MCSLEFLSAAKIRNLEFTMCLAEVLYAPGNGAEAVRGKGVQDKLAAARVLLAGSVNQS